MVWYWIRKCLVFPWPPYLPIIVQCLVNCSTALCFLVFVFHLSFLFYCSLSTNIDFVLHFYLLIFLHSYFGPFYSFPLRVRLFTRLIVISLFVVILFVSCFSSHDSRVVVFCVVRRGRIFFCTFFVCTYMCCTGRCNTVYYYSCVSCRARRVLSSIYIVVIILIMLIYLISACYNFRERLSDNSNSTGFQRLSEHQTQKFHEKNKNC